MPTRQEYEKSSLAGGEISPALHAATDLRQNQIGVESQENFVTVLEGIAVRRPGTRFVLEAKDHNQRGKLWPFRYASGDYYMLAFNGGAMRVIRDAGYVASGPAPFELAIPWTEAQLPSLRAAALENTLTFTSAGGRVQKITRHAADNWTISEYMPVNGPIDAQNLDVTKTILVSGISGQIALMGTNSPFDLGMLGGVMRIDEADAVLTQLWTANASISAPLVAPPAVTSLIGSLTPLSNLTDGNAATDATLTSTECFAGFNWASAVAVAAMTIFGSAHGGGPGLGLGAFTSTSATLVLELWGKNGGTPSGPSDGTLLASQTFVDNPSYATSGLTLYVANATLAWNNFWFRLRSLSGSVTFTVSSAASSVLASGGLTLRRYGENIYQALGAGNSGASPPVHDSGDADYGGLTWRFRSKIYGFVRITAVADANLADADVILPLPDSALLRATYRWWPPSWSDGAGWPDNIQQHQQKFLFFRKNRMWATRPATRDDFLFTPDADSAIAISLSSPDGSLVETEWVAAAGIVVLGAADSEWMLRAPGSNDVLQAQTIDPVPDGGEGSIAQIPARVDRGVIFIGRDGKRLHYTAFDGISQQISTEEISAYARHILGAGAAQVVWQRDPHKLAWIRLDDGTLASATFMPKQKIVAFHRHPMTNAFIEDIAALPATDDGKTEIYLWVRRLVNGQTKRYIELLQPFFEPANAASPTAAGAWFVDCGLRYHGTPVARVTGLTHLIHQTVAVHADGAMQRRKVVDGAGGIDLDAGASDVVIGLPQIAYLKDLPRSLQIGGGSTRGKVQHANTVIIDVLNSAGGVARMTHPKTERYADDHPEVPFDALVETGADFYGQPIKLFTGQIPLTVTDEGATSAVIEIVCDDTMPMTIRALVPELIVEGD